MKSDSSYGWTILVLAIVVVVFASFGISKHRNDNKVCPVGDTSCGSTADQNISANTTRTSSGSSTASPAVATTPSTPTCYSAAQAANEEGKSGCVRFVGYAYTSYSGQMYLDQYTSAPYGFSAWIPAGSSFGPGLLNEFSGKTMTVSGMITPYNGEPEIVVTSASQIQ